MNDEIRNVRRMLDRIEDAVNQIEYEYEDAIRERDDYSEEVTTKEEEIKHFEDEICFLCRLVVNNKDKAVLPKEGHYVDINPYVPRNDPNRGKYEFDPE